MPDGIGVLLCTLYRYLSQCFLGRLINHIATSIVIKKITPCLKAQPITHTNPSFNQIQTKTQIHRASNHITQIWDLGFVKCHRLGKCHCIKERRCRLTYLKSRGIGMNLDVVRPGRGSGGVTRSGDPRGRAPGGVRGRSPLEASAFKKFKP